MIAIQKIDILRSTFENFPIDFIKGFGSKSVMKNDELSGSRSQTRFEKIFFVFQIISSDNVNYPRLNF